jgi:methylphosphotriester-DNA--protein-cysteine methyltransferase
MSFTTDQSRWRALTIRDPLADGKFVYSVKSTRIYCRPTCPARLARRANVGFFKTAAEAEAAGYRACKRCKPEIEVVDDPQARAVSKACAFIDAALKSDSPASLKLQDLAKSVGLTPRYFHKIFKDKKGMTPKEYATSKEHDLLEQNTIGATNEGLVDMPFDFELLDTLDPMDYDLSNLNTSMDPAEDWLQKGPNDLMDIFFGQEIDANLGIPSCDGIDTSEPSLLPDCGVDGLQGLDWPLDIGNSLYAPRSAPSIEVLSIMHLEANSQPAFYDAIAAPISDTETWSAIPGQAKMLDNNSLRGNKEQY